jgi:hypothetical protein
MPLWLDFDDALLEVPPDNPAYNIYAQDSIKQNIIRLCSMADHISFTTEALRESFQRHVTLPESSIIPNAYNDYLLPLKPPVTSQNSLVFWRGSDSHQGDLLEFAASYHRAMQEFPDYQYLFMGMVPWMLPPGATFTYNKGVDIFDFFPILRNTIRPAIQVVPLIDSHFNRAKSNIAWIEAASVGAVTVAPEWAEWEHAGVFTYNDTESFFTALDAALHLPQDERDSMAHAAWLELESNYFLSSINEQRQLLIEKLT